MLLLTATIWGLAFVAQRVGMKYVGPFTFNGIRFLLGCFPLLPIILWNFKKDPFSFQFQPKMVIFGGAVTGCVLFLGASLQQIGIVYTTAGKAGFITGLYVIIVPLLGLLWRDRSTHAGTWGGAVLAAIGMYFLSVTRSLTISLGDVLVFFSAFMWAGHVQLVGWFSPRIGAVRLAVMQYAICGLLSLIVAFFREHVVLSGIIQGALPILYGGLLSVGVAYTLQLVAQKDAPPSHAAVLMSLETVFAALGGWLILGETLSHRALFGCVLILTGILASQLYPVFRKTA